ncbi:MAG TPA: alpha/beta hydrolase, partial [Gammaproteobacteria bacterium]|nr:alpha/beta hydrolase [Gammaproteobacteria bacterium]
MSNLLHQAVGEKHPARVSPAKAGRPQKPHSMPLMLRVMRAGFRIGGTLTPKLAGRVAYRLWFTPTRYKTPASEKEALQSAVMDRQLIQGQTIATYQWGQSGPKVLLVHGWSGRGTQLGSFVKPLMSAGFRVLSFDGPAHGVSTGKQTNLFEFAHVIQTLNDIYGPFDSVITHSFGGPCLTLAIKKGFNTSRVVNISPPSNMEALVKKFCSTLSIPAKAEQDLKRRIEKKFGSNIWQEISMLNHVRDINMPALVIHDEDDVDIDWQDGETVAQSWNNARFIKTSGLGHRRILRDRPTI